MSLDPNQLGGGLAFPCALGVQFSYAQIRGGLSPADSNTFSTVTLLQAGNIISALPGSSSVDIGDTDVGFNTQYISQMAGTTMINSPLIVNGNVVIPHQYNFSMNPEQNAILPTATINANLNVGSATLSNVVANFTTNTFNILSGSGVSISSFSVGIGASTISLYSDETVIDGKELNIYQTISTSITSPSFSVNSDTTVITGGSVGLTATINAGLASEGGIYLYSQTQDINAEQSIRIGSETLSTLTQNTNMHTSNVMSNYAGTQYLIGDGGINPAFEPYVTIQSGGGYQGRVNVIANPGLSDLGLGLGGVVQIDAFGSSNDVITYGGLITLNAYSGGFGEYGGLGSAIRLNASQIGISAGASYALPGFPGSLNLFGNGVVSLVSALVPPTAPQIPETVFICGLLGTNIASPAGIQLQDDTYIKAIYPLSGAGDLIIAGRTLPTANVQLQDIVSMTMTSTNGVINNLSSINNSFTFGSNGNLGGISSINGIAYPSSTNVSQWSQFPQLYTLSTFSTLAMTASTIAANTISTSSIYFSSVNGQLPPAWNGNTGTDNLVMNGYSLENVGLLTCAAAGFRDMTISTILVSTINGFPFTGGGGSSTWISTATSDLNMNLYNISNVQQGNFREITSSTISVSTINGYPFTGGGGSSIWVSTATSDLNMSSYSINNATSISVISSISTSDIQTTTINGNPYQNIQEVTTPYNSGILVTEPPNISISIGNRPYDYLLFDTGAQRLHVVTQPGQYNIQANPMVGLDLGLDLVIDAELSLKGQYIIQNANISGGNNMTISTKVYFVGTYYAFAAFQLAPGQSYSFQVVSHPNSVGGAVGVITGYQNLGIINPYFSI